MNFIRMKIDTESCFDWQFVRRRGRKQPTERRQPFVRNEKAAVVGRRDTKFTDSDD